MEEKNLIKRDMKIGDMVRNYPQTAKIMNSWGLACVGCHVNVFETVEEGARSHGQMNEEEIEELMIELNKVAKPLKKFAIGEMFITDRAIKKIKQIAIDEEKKDDHLQILVEEEEGDNHYSLEFVKEGVEGIYFEVENQKFVIDDVSADRIKGFTIDFVQSPLETGFKFEKS